jgi:hypothetical protein
VHRLLQFHSTHARQKWQYIVRLKLPDAPYQKSGIISTDKQFGKKIGEHAMDDSLDPSRPEGRERMWLIIEDICSAATETSKLMMIYSKTGTHLVPRKENE